MFSIDDLDRDTGDVDSQSRGTNDEYFYDEVTGTLEGGGRWVGGGRGAGVIGSEGVEGDRGKGWGWEVAMVSIERVWTGTDSQSRGTNDEYFYEEVT